MPTSFYIFLIVCFVSFILVIRDHEQAWESFKQSKGNECCRKGLHLFALWFVPVFSLIGTLYLGRESIDSGKQDKKRDQTIIGLSNRMQQVSTEYSEATNDLAAAQKHLAALQPRSISTNDQQKLLLALANVSRANVVFNIDAIIPDAEPLANVLANVLVQRGFSIIGADRMTPSGGRVNNGISVNIIGQTDSSIATEVIEAFNSIGLNAHTPVFSAVRMGSSSGNATNGVLYIDIGFRQ